MTLIVSYLNVHAQDNTGKKVFALGFGAATTNYSLPSYSSSNNSINVDLTLGKYKTKTLMKYWKVSAGFSGYQWETLANNNSFKSTSSNFLGGLSRGCEYYKPVFGKFSMYGALEAGIAFIHDGYDYISQERNSNIIRLNVGGNAGFIYAINPKWQLKGTFLNLNALNTSYEWVKVNSALSSTTVSLTENSTSLKYSITPTVNLTYGLSVRYLF